MISSAVIRTTANGTTIEAMSNVTINISHIQVTPMFPVMVHADLSKPVTWVTGDSSPIV